MLVNSPRKQESEGAAAAWVDEDAGNLYEENDILELDQPRSGLDNMFPVAIPQCVKNLTDTGTLRTTGVNSSIVRGVLTTSMLSGFGKYWSRLDGGNYELSAQVEQLDDFISHDWATGRWVKYMTLSVAYNVWPAFLASHLVGLLVCCVQMILAPETSTITGYNFKYNITKFGETKEYDYPRHFWCNLLCTASFFFVFLFFQRIKELFRFRLRRCFVDKHCICQDDERLKSQGIYGLGGIIKQSDRLVLLYSARTFKRLWCVFELATWLLLHERIDNSVLFLPVDLVRVSAIIFFSCMSAVLGYHFRSLWGVIFPGLQSVVYMIMGLTVVIAPVVSAHIMRHAIHNLGSLHSMLKKFDAASVQCFCCSNNHVHPETSEVLMCDRQLVYETMKDWFGKADDPDDQSHLVAFNDHVRTTFAQWVQAKVGKTYVPYRVCVLLFSPMLWKSWDVIPETYHNLEDPLIIADNLSQMLFVAFVSMPCLGHLWVRGTVFMDGVVGVSRYKILDVAISVIYAAIVLFAWMFLWYPLQLGLMISLVWHVGTVCLALFLFRPFNWSRVDRVSKGALVVPAPVVPES